MVNLEARSKTPEPVGICYFLAPRTRGEEVRFSQVKPPEVQVKPPEHKVTDYCDLKYDEAKRAITQCLALIFVVGFLAFPFGVEIFLAHFGPQPSARIIPPPPYYEGETIIGLSTKGQYHSWVYYPKAGWVDP